MLGVSDKTVGRVRTDMVAIAEIPQFETTEGFDGKKRKKPIRSTFIDDTLEGQKEALAVAKDIQADINSPVQVSCKQLRDILQTVNLYRFIAAMVIKLPFGYQQAPTHAPK